MMVLVNDRIAARRETSSMTMLQLDIVTDLAPVTEEVTEGEPSGTQVGS